MTEAQSEFLFKCQKWDLNRDLPILSHHSFILMWAVYICYSNRWSLLTPDPRQSGKNGVPFGLPKLLGSPSCLEAKTRRLLEPRNLRPAEAM